MKKADIEYQIKSMENMKSGLMKTCVETMRTLPNVWEKMDEESQQAYIDTIEVAVNDQVRSAIATIVGGEYFNAKGILKQVNYGDKDSKALIVLNPTAESTLDLNKHRHCSVMIVVTGGVDGVPHNEAAEKDQSDLDL